MLFSVKRSKYLKVVLGDPVHVVLFTVANAIVVAATSTAEWWWGHQVAAIVVVAVIYFAVASFLGEMRYRDELFRALPGQIRYSNVTKKLAIKESGFGDLTYEFTGLNMGESYLRSLYHVCDYDRESPVVPPIQAFIEDTPVQVSLNSHSKLSGRQVIGHQSRIEFDFPLPVKKRCQFPRHTFRLESLDYRKALAGSDYSSHRVEVLTDHLMIEISVPSSLRLTGVQEKVVDFHGREDPLETRRVRTECPVICSRDQSKVVWEISKPRLTYAYRLFFAIQKRT